jgi:hypothetical protein
LYLDYIPPLVCSQCQVDAIYFDLSSAFDVVPLGYGLLLFNVFTNDLCSSNKHLRYFLFADNIKIFRTISSVANCTHLQSDTYSIHGWCAANHMKHIIDKTKAITFTRKTNAANYKDKLCDKCTNRAGSVRDLGVLSDSKLYLHHHVDYIVSQSLKMLVLTNQLHGAVLLEKLTGPQLVKKFPAFYGTRRFITVLTRASHLSLS